jgi:hypothetical protein
VLLQHGASPLVEKHLGTRMIEALANDAAEGDPDATHRFLGFLPCACVCV